MIRFVLCERLSRSWSGGCALGFAVRGFFFMAGQRRQVSEDIAWRGEVFGMISELICYGIILLLILVGGEWIYLHYFVLDFGS